MIDTCDMRYRVELVTTCPRLLNAVHTRVSIGICFTLTCYDSPLGSTLEMLLRLRVEQG